MESFHGKIQTKDSIIDEIRRARLKLGFTMLLQMIKQTQNNLKKFENGEFYRINTHFGQVNRKTKPINAIRETISGKDDKCIEQKKALVKRAGRKGRDED